MLEIFSPEFFIGISFASIAIVLVKYLNSKYQKFPPGPVGLPIVGYLPFLTKKPHLKFEELGKKYGNVFSIQLGSRRFIVLNDGEAIKEAFSKPEFLGRPPQPTYALANIKSPFFGTTDHKTWIEHKRFTAQALRDLGIGKSKIHDHVQDEIQHLIQCIWAENGRPINIRKILAPSMSNNVCSLVFGKRYEYEDKERILLDNSLEKTSASLAQVSSLVFFPWLTYPLIRTVLNMKEISCAFEVVQSFIKKKIKLHKETVDPKYMRDFLDSYIIEQKNRTVKNADTTFSDTLLSGTVQNLLGAGSETVRVTVEWCLLTLAAYPDVQNKVLKELDEVVGNQRLPNFSDQTSMPYTQAVLQEVQRWQTSVPINVVRATLGDIQIFDYTIPKDTNVMANLWGAHHDPKTWDKPHKFIPERFLSPDGKTVIKNEYYMPFSYGKRSCLGEGLAVLETFLYVTTILQKFSIKVPDGETVDFDGELSITYHMKPQNLCFIPRK